MKLILSYEKADWNSSPFGSDKLVLVVKFPNCISATTGRPFKWLPTYDQLDQIKEALDKIERISWNLKGDTNEKKNDH